MVLLLDELNIFGVSSNFSIIVEKYYLNNVSIENTDFIETKFTQTDKVNYGIMKKLDEKFNSSLRLKQINDYKNIYSVSWQNPKTLFNDFSTYIYVDDYAKFINEKKHYEEHLGVNLVDIKKTDIADILESRFDNMDKAVIEILKEQKKAMTPSILYYIFEDVLDKKKMKTIKRISFI